MWRITVEKTKQLDLLTEDILGHEPNQNVIFKSLWPIFFFFKHVLMVGKRNRADVISSQGQICHYYQQNCSGCYTDGDQLLVSKLKFAKVGRIGIRYLTSSLLLNNIAKQNHTTCFSGVCACRTLMEKLLRNTGLEHSLIVSKKIDLTWM